MTSLAVEAIATSSADDLAYRALADVTTLTKHLDVRIVGGQMVGLLLTAFRTPEAVVRRTADADAALTTQVAASGEVHDVLIAAGYEATSGNSYSKSGQQIDLLVPARAGRFTQQEAGGRAFDAAPGLGLVLAGEPIHLKVNVTMADGELLSFDARLPTVEHAVVLKAAAYASRHSAKDITDLHNLLQIVHEHNPTDIGGWTLKSPGLRGARGDAQGILHRLADRARRLVTPATTGVRSDVFAALVRSHVGLPR